jgi:hypothetical protein
VENDIIFKNNNLKNNIKEYKRILFDKINDDNSSS